MPEEKFTPSFTFTADRLAALKAIAPEAFNSEDQLDWEALRLALGDAVEDGKAESFGLNWPGKRDARRLALAPARKALHPAPGEGVDEDTTRNIFIEGDDLEALKLLRKAYAGRVKMIYIDPPYNTGNDFIYKDDFRESAEDYEARTGQRSEEGERLVANPKSSGRFHSNWLNMIYPRLMLARELLREDGVIFVSIDDNEVHNLRQVMDEVFGAENFVGVLVWEGSKKGDAKLISTVHEYVLVFVLDKAEQISQHKWRLKKAGVDEVLAKYDEFRAITPGQHDKIAGRMREWYASLSRSDERRAHEHYRWSDDRGLYFAADFAGPDDGRKSRPRYDIIHPVTGKPCKKPSTGWRWDEDKTLRALAENPPRIHFGSDETTIPCRKSYLFEIDSAPLASVFYRDGRAATLEVEKLVGPGLFDFPKDADVIKRFIELVDDPSGLFMDFFAGSGSMAQAIIEKNLEDHGRRRYLLVQLPEPIEAKHYKNLAEVSRARIKNAVKELKKQSRHRIVTEQAALPIERGVVMPTTPDFGFKVFTVGDSNFKQWADYGGEEMRELQMRIDEATAQPLQPGWKVDAVLTEIALQEGFPLDSAIDKAAEFKRNAVRRISHDSCQHRLFVCLDERLYADTIRELRLQPEDVFICFDNALTDEAKLRLADACKLKVI